MAKSNFSGYRGRIAPTPTGYLHLGHARTFLEAQMRARKAKGVLLMRIEDLDGARCKPEFADAVYEDLKWAELEWDEGPDLGGDFGPYVQSERRAFFQDAWTRLRELGLIYPCDCSRKDVALATTAPHEDGGEHIYPGTCRTKRKKLGEEDGDAVNWRFRVPDGEVIRFVDQRMGELSFVAGKDFGDFLVWRKDGIPSYELAVVADDIAMKITEVVRGEDLLVSTARQIMLYRAFGCETPKWYHCPLVLDSEGKRLAKRDSAMGLRELRERGVSSVEFREMVERAKVR